MAKLYKIAKIKAQYDLAVSALHTIHVWDMGNPNGVPVVHLHGGPGSSSRARYSKYYDSTRYRIIIFDQRGCGKSTPLGETQENTTWDLVDDMEKIRKHLGINKWIVSGGSWGSTLALAYAQKYLQSVLALILRAVFTFREFEVNWVQKAGASYFFPEEWEKYKNFIPENEQGDLVGAYAKRVLSNNKDEQISALKHSDYWAKSILSLVPKNHPQEATNSVEELAATKIFYHYEVNRGFLKEGELIDNAHKLKGIPGMIIQGRYDMICPPITAWQLHKAWVGSKLEIITGGHFNKSGEATRKLVEYTDALVVRFS